VTLHTFAKHLRFTHTKQFKSVQGPLLNQLNECTNLHDLEMFITATYRKDEEFRDRPEKNSLILEHLIHKSLDLVYPNEGKTCQFKLLKSVIREIATFDFDDKDQLKCAVGGEVATLVGQVKNSKQRIHLLSILCGHMRKKMRRN